MKYFITLALLLITVNSSFLRELAATEVKISTIALGTTKCFTQGGSETLELTITGDDKTPTTGTYKATFTTGLTAKDFSDTNGAPVESTKNIK